MRVNGIKDGERHRQCSQGSSEGMGGDEFVKDGTSLSLLPSANVSDTKDSQPGRVPSKGIGERER